MLCAGEAVCFITSTEADNWQLLLNRAGEDLRVLPPPLGFRDISLLNNKLNNISILFQLANQVEKEQHQV